MLSQTAERDSEPGRAAFSNAAPQTDDPIYLDDNNRLVAGMPAAQRQPAATAPVQTQAKNAPAEAKSPTGRSGEMYVHTWGAQGEVWGTVMMNGNSGHGTIHDAEEHSYDIRVSRRGNELLGTDQKGREYIFKQ